METLIEKIKKDHISSVKEKNIEKRLVLSTLIGELDRVTKEPADLFVLTTIKKMIENNKLTNNEKENSYLETYLPIQLDDATIELTVDMLINTNDFSSIKDMGKIMNFFKENYPGQYSNTDLSRIAKSKLS